MEQEIINRCSAPGLSSRFQDLLKRYAARAEAVGSGFDMNPSPGNIRDGLITDAMKSAGAALKGGRSPVKGVLDYTEPCSEDGLNLLCTPGNDGVHHCLSCIGCQYYFILNWTRHTDWQPHCPCHKSI